MYFVETGNLGNSTNPEPWNIFKTQEETKTTPVKIK